MVLLQGLVAVTTSVRLKILKSKNVYCLHSQKPWVLISALDTFELFDVLPCSYSPDNCVNLGSISVSLHTFDIIFAVRSRKSLWRIYIKPPFRHLIQCWISNLQLQGQDVSWLFVFLIILESHWIPVLLLILFKSKFCNWNYCQPVWNCR